MALSIAQPRVLLDVLEVVLLLPDLVVLQDYAITHMLTGVIQDMQLINTRVVIIINGTVLVTTEELLRELAVILLRQPAPLVLLGLLAQEVLNLAQPRVQLDVLEVALLLPDLVVLQDYAITHMLMGVIQDMQLINIRVVIIINGTVLVMMEVLLLLPVVIV